jgi:hypothetical protein
MKGRKGEKVNSKTKDKSKKIKSEKQKEKEELSQNSQRSTEVHRECDSM